MASEPTLIALGEAYRKAKKQVQDKAVLRFQSTGKMEAYKEARTAAIKAAVAAADRLLQYIDEMRKEGDTDSK